MEDAVATTTSAENQQIAERVAGAILGMDYILDEKFRPVSALVEAWRDKALGDIGLLVRNIMEVHLDHLEEGGDEWERALEPTELRRADLYGRMIDHLTKLADTLDSFDGREWLGTSPELKDL
jgi:hypothetical protein